MRTSPNGSAAPVAAVVETAADKRDEGLRSKILLVDDRRENLLALAAVLEPLGHDLILARSGTEALKYLLTETFAVILLDVQMPDMDGFETATLIKQRERSRHIPIIFITAINKEEQYVFRGYQAGAVDYLSKPIDPDMLRSKVQVFVELDQQRRMIEAQAEELRRVELREAKRQREEEAREQERRHLTELAKREAQLREFKETLDATLDAVFLFDPETLRFTYVNEGAARLLGYSTDSLLTKTPLDLGDEIARAEFEATLAPLRDAARKDQGIAAQIFEMYVQHHSGKKIPVEVLTQYVAPTGGPGRFVSIVRDITERKRSEAQLARLYEREKRIAEALQQSIVLAPPEDLFPGLKIATLYEAAWDEASVGGDYLDVFALEKGKIALVVGDVSGKGLTAAARTAEAKYALRAFLRETPDPARALCRLNTLLCETVRLEVGSEDAFPGAGQFICISVAVLDVETGEGSCAIAGAEPPLIVRRHERVSLALEGTGMPVGIAPAGEYQNIAMSLERGDLFLMVTDGITEARQGREFFGYEGLASAAVDCAGQRDVQQVARTIVSAARDFAGGKLRDDVCLLLASRT